MTANPISLAPDTSLGPTDENSTTAHPASPRLRRSGGRADDRNRAELITSKPLGRRDWLVPTLLIALSAAPIAGGIVRLVQLAGGAEITPDNARFFAAPLPVVLHIISVGLYCLLGAFQFAPGFRQRQPTWHRAAGRILVPCGLIAALSGLWLTQFYPPVDGDGPLLYGIGFWWGRRWSCS